MSEFRSTPMAAPAGAAQPPYQAVDLARLATPLATGPSELDVARTELEQQGTALQAISAQLAALCRELGGLRAQVLAEVPPQMTEAALLLAEQIVEHAITVDATIVQRCAQQVLAEVVMGSALQLRLNPEDMALLAQQQPDALQAFAGQPELSVAADDALPRGVVRIDGERFRVEGGIPHRMSRVWAQLLGGQAAPGGVA